MTASEWDLLSVYREHPIIMGCVCTWLGLLGLLTVVGLALAEWVHWQRFRRNELMDRASKCTTAPTPRHHHRAGTMTQVPPQLRHQRHLTSTMDWRENARPPSPVQVVVLNDTVTGTVSPADTGIPTNETANAATTVADPAAPHQSSFSLPAHTNTANSSHGSKSSSSGGSFSVAGIAGTGNAAALTLQQIVLTQRHQLQHAATLTEFPPDAPIPAPATQTHHIGGALRPGSVLKPARRHVRLMTATTSALGCVMLFFSIIHAWRLIITWYDHSSLTDDALQSIRVNLHWSSVLERLGMLWYVWGLGGFVIVESQVIFPMRMQVRYQRWRRCWWYSMFVVFCVQVIPDVTLLLVYGAQPLAWVILCAVFYSLCFLAHLLWAIYCMYKMVPVLKEANADTWRIDQVQRLRLTSVILSIFSVALAVIILLFLVDILHWFEWILVLHTSSLSVILFLFLWLSVGRNTALWTTIQQQLDRRRTYGSNAQGHGTASATPDAGAPVVFVDVEGRKHTYTPPPLILTPRRSSNSPRRMTNLVTHGSHDSAGVLKPRSHSMVMLPATPTAGKRLDARPAQGMRPDLSRAQTLTLALCQQYDQQIRARSPTVEMPQVFGSIHTPSANDTVTLADGVQPGPFTGPDPIPMFEQSTSGTKTA